MRKALFHVKQVLKPSNDELSTIGNFKNKRFITVTNTLSNNAAVSLKVNLALQQRRRERQDR